jgi:hypothetical protein
MRFLHHTRGDVLETPQADRLRSLLSGNGPVATSSLNLDRLVF